MWWPLRVQPLLDDIGDRRFAGAGQAGEPDDRRLLLVQRGTFGLADQERLPMDVGAAAQTESNHAGANSMIGKSVDDDERAGFPVLLVGIESDGNRGRQVAKGDVVQFELGCRKMITRVHVNLVFDRSDRHWHDLRPDAAQVRASGEPEVRRSSR